MLIWQLTLGEGAEDVLTSTGITSQEKAKYDKVLEKFNNFFQVRKNVIFERARLNQRNLGEVRKRRPTNS